ATATQEPGPVRSPLLEPVSRSLAAGRRVRDVPPAGGGPGIHRRGSHGLFLAMSQRIENSWHGPLARGVLPSPTRAVSPCPSSALSPDRPSPGRDEIALGQLPEAGDLTL